MYFKALKLLHPATLDGRTRSKFREHGKHEKKWKILTSWKYQPAEHQAKCRKPCCISFLKNQICALEKYCVFFNLLHSRRNWWNDKYLRCLYWSGNFDKGAISGEIETNLSNFVQFVQLLAQKQFQIIWNGTLSPESSYITNNQILEIISSIIAQIISQIIRYWKLSLRILLKLYKSANCGSY